MRVLFFGERCKGLLRKVRLRNIKLFNFRLPNYYKYNELKSPIYRFRCQYANYCSTNCLEKDKAIHNAECYYLSKKRTGNPGSDTCRMLLRIILTQRSPGAKKMCDIVPGRRGSITLHLQNPFYNV